MLKRFVKTWSVVLCGTVLSVLLVVQAANSQTLVSGGITGVVTDPSGAVVSDATVELKSVATAATQSTKTSAAGAYRFSLLLPGRYVITVSHAGFQTMDRQATVALGQTTPINFTLAVGQASTTVEVTGTAPVLNTETGNMSTSLDPRDISTLPNPGGDLTNYAQIAPGVTMNTSNGYGNFTANGLPATSNLFTVNGENDMDPFFNISNSGATNLMLGQNEIQEATIVTNPYSGQYGQQAGAQVNYITKSGTNDFHGSAKYLWNGRVFNANEWFANNQGTPRGFANNNQWGADFGGPIKKDKVFFYVNNEGLRYVLPTAQNVFIPSPQFTSAVLANVATTNPASLATYQQLFNIWDNPTSPGAQNARPVANSCDDIINANGSSNLPGITAATPCALNFRGTPTALSDEWILSGRVDVIFSDSDKVFFRLRSDQGTQATYTDPINSAFNATSNQPQYDGQSQWTHIFNSTLTNQFIVAGSWYTAIFKQAPVANSTFPYGFNFQSTIFDQMAASPFTGVMFLRWDFPQGRNVTQYQVIDDVSWVKGKHTFKFGGNFRRYDVSDFNNQIRVNPEIYVRSLLDFANATAFEFRKTFPTSTGVPIALYGMGAYAQDEWNVTPKLKLTLALRGEHNSNPVCQTNCFSQFRVPFQQLPTNPNLPYRVAIQTNLHQAFRGTNPLNLSPRLAFVWSPFGNDQTVVSGGVGLFYDALAQSVVEPAFENAPNNVDQRVFTGLWANPTPAGALSIATQSALSLKNGFAQGASYGSLVAQTGGVFRAPSFTNFPSTFNTPQYQEWSLQLQQAIGNNMAFTMAYVGTHGIYVPVENATLNAWDEFGFGGGFPPAVPNPSYATTSQWFTGANSNTNNMTASFIRRFTRGLSFQANYTWGHALDDISNGGINAYDLTTSIVSQLNPASLRANNYGNADYDIRNNFNANFVWEPPYKFNNKKTDAVLGGWTFSGTLFARSGLPYTIEDGNSSFPNLGGNGLIVGQAVAEGPTFGQTGNCNTGNALCFFQGSFVDTSTTGLPAYPNQRRNQYRGPSFSDINFSLQKNVNLTERFKFGLGFNFYNLFNHPNFYLPNAFLSSGDPTVGRIQQTVAVPASPYGAFQSAAASPRLIQLQARLVF